MENKTYLGDGVYISTDRGMVRLTTENGSCASNTIWMEDHVLESFIIYIKHIKSSLLATQDRPR